ncbi:MAG: BrnT family toxin [Phycisphaerae bacterium]
MTKATFEWDDKKDRQNQMKHGVSFYEAQYAFADHKRVILEDLEHSRFEKRYYCLGAVERGLLTVRFTFRGNVIRIIGAGFWRKGKDIYEKQNKIHE